MMKENRMERVFTLLRTIVALVLTVSLSVSSVAVAPMSLMEARQDIVSKVSNAVAGQARIGETGYATLTEALAAVQDDQTVTLTADVTGHFSTDRTLILDLDGHTLTVDAEEGVQAVDGGSLTLQNGAVTSEESNIISARGGSVTLGTGLTVSCTATVIHAGSDGSVVVDGAAVTCTGERNAAACAGGTGASVSVKSGSVSALGNYALIAAGGGALEITGGSVTGGEGFRGVLLLEDAASGAAISGGVVNGVNAMAGTAVITGGSFSGPVSGTTPDNLMISGGHYRESVPEECLADGLICAAETGGYAVVEEGHVVTITADSASREYDGTELTAEGYTCTELVQGDKLDSVAVTGSQTDAGTGQNVPAEAKIVNGDGEDVTDRYAVTYVNGVLEVTRRPATVRAQDVTKLYGDPDQPAALVTGLVGEDTLDYTLTRTEGEDVGAYPVTPAGEAEQGNYTVTYEPGVLTIQPAPVVVTAESKEKVCGEDDPALTAAVTGLKNGDDAAAVSYALGPRTQGENAGAYDIPVTGDAEQGNYAVTFEKGTFTILPCPVTVTVTGHQDTADYDGREHAVSGYDLEISDDRYTEADFRFSGTAEAAQTDAGAAMMGLTADQFTNTNENYDVTFSVTDGFQRIDPLSAVVTVTGSRDTADYDGAEHRVDGYTVTAEPSLYDADRDLRFLGVAEAVRTEPGTTEMGLAADQFENENPNFSDVTVNVTDGAITVAPAPSHALSPVNEGAATLVKGAALSAYKNVSSIFRKTLTASDGTEFLVTVTYNQAAGIPAGAELSVTEIKEGDAGYEEYVARSADVLGEKPEELALARAFDIKLMDPETGEAYQPDQDVKVTIALLKDDLDQYSNVDVVHIPDEPGKEAQVMDSTMRGEAVTFTTDGFSVYVLTSGQQPPQCVFEFNVWDEDVDNYVLYGSTQTVKSGETPVIPMPPSDDSREFVGWYEEESEGVLKDEPFDFEAFAEVPLTENEVKTLYAKFTDFAYVVFYDQYDEASGTWPVAFTRRAELKEDPDTHETCAWVQIDDLSATYSGSQSMAFCGWSTTEIKTPGTYENPDTNESYAISWAEGDQHSGMIKVTEAGTTPLYPIYRSIHYLTYYTAQSGLGAEYVPPAGVFDGEGLSKLPEPTRDGYDFQGWYTGTLLTSTVNGKTVEEVSFSNKVTDESGSLADEYGSPYLTVADSGVYPQQGKLKLSANATLYAKWKAHYNVVIWVQSPSESPDTAQKTYQYYVTKTYTAEIGTSVSVPAECKALTIEGYEYSHCDESKEIKNTKDVTVLNVYYNLTGPYSPAPGSYALTFRDSVTGPAASEMPHAYDGTEGYDKIAAGTKLETISVTRPSDRTSNGHVTYKFKGWYMDQACTVPADLSTMTMPDRDLTLYAGWSAEWFIVNIDPNYGALYYYDGGELKGTGSTWFWQTYDSEPIGEYTHATRDYVPSGSGSYYYVNRDRAYYGYSGNEWDNSEKDRQTFYTPNISEATEDATFEYAPGTYSYLGWYEVYANGTEADAPYDFTQKTDHHTTLRLRWKQSGEFYLAYDAGAGKLDSSSGAQKDTVSQLSDCYTDYAQITMNRVAVPSNNSLSFVGWRVKDDTAGPIYALGETFTLHAGDAVRESGRDVVWLEAVYAGKQTVTVVYDANGGTITADDVDYGIIPGTPEPTPIADENKSVDADNGTVTVLGLANNSSYTLSSGAGFAWNGRDPIGWSNVPVYDPGDPEAELYTLGGTYGVDVNGGSTTTLYAVWGVTVTYQLNSTTASWNPNPSIYHQDSQGNYTCVSYLGWDKTSHSMVGLPVSEPADIPNSGSADSMFYYWTDGTTDTNSGEYIPFDFSQPVTQDTNLFAVWDGAIEVPVTVIDASNEALTTSAGGSIAVQTGEVSLDALADSDSYMPAGTPAYHYAFAVALNKNETPTRETVFEADAVTSVYYSQANKHLYVKYKDGRSDTWLDEDTQLYFVYYQEEALYIGYSSMDTSGVLTSVSADTQTGLLGEYNMAGIELNGFAGSGYSHYAYALGSKIAENASQLRLITETSTPGGDAPVLRVKNTWSGFWYTTETGDDAVWYDGGFAPQLYAVYFEQKPTVIMIHEETVGAEAVMDTAFTYHIVITQTEKTGDTTTTTTIYDSDAVDDGNGGTVVHEYKLKSGEAQSAVLYYSNDGTKETTQTITVTQEADSAFTTKIGPIEMVSWSYTSSADGTLQNVTFTNRHNTLPVEVHVALLEDDGTVRNMDSTLRSDSHSFDVALGETEDFLENLPSSTIFTDETGTYALGAILCGSETTDGIVTAAEMGVDSISYGQVNGNHYELLLDGSADKPLGGYQVYYLYYRMPRILYVKSVEGSTLTQVTGANGFITYNGEPLTMNDVTVEQNQRLLLPVNGELTISQSGNHFRMPPNLDDGESVRYLTYTRLGVGGPNITSLGGLTMGSGLDLHLRLHQSMTGEGQKTALEYSFDGSTWTAFDSTGWTEPTPTIYAVYQERGYDLLIGKTVNTSASGAKPLFTQATFTVTIESDAITKDSYDVEGYENATIAATPATDTAPGRIVLEDVGDGTSIRFKSLTRGEYTLTETENENYVLTAQTGPIVGNTQAVQVEDDGSTIHLTLDSEKKLELTNTPRKLCKIVDGGTEHVFYTFADAMEYVAANIVDYTATVEMLSDYLMPEEDVLWIPAGYHITLTTAENGTNQYEGSQGRATISRSESMAGSVLIRNEGELTLNTVVLDGKNVQATAPLIQSSGTGLTVGQYAVLQNAHNTTDGGAIYANAGDVTISQGQIKDCFAGYKAETQIPEGAPAAKGGAICYLGSGTVTLDNATVQRNEATGDGGAIYAAQGTLVLTNHADVSGNTAGGSGGAIYAGNSDITVEKGASMTGNTAQQSGGAIYAATATIQVKDSDTSISNNTANNTAAAADGGGGAIYISQGSVSVSGGSMSGNKAEKKAENGSGGAIYSGSGGAIYAGSAAVSLSDDGSLISNTAKSGGAVYAQSGTVTVSGGSMSKNTAGDGSGGAIYAGSGAVSLTDGSLTGNTAAAGDSGDGYGGAVYAHSGTVTVVSSTIGGADTTEDTKKDGNSAFSGGAIFSGSGAVTVTDSSLNWNTAENIGGAIYALTGNVTLKTESGSLSLGKNKATGGNGGAIYAYGGNVSVSGGSVTGNTAGGKGGVVYAASGTAALIASQVTNNAATGDGGVICTGSNGGVTVTDCPTVTGNTSGGKGGVICTESGSVTVSGSFFGGNGDGEGNRAVSGGVLYTESGTVSVTGSDMTKNAATTGNGGALCTASGSITASGVSMTGNTATEGNGGAIYADSGTVSVNASTVNSVTTNSSLNSNSAKNGGALYIGSGTANLNTVTMTGNTAAENGGAAYAESGNLTLAGGTMTQNTAGIYGGVAYAGSGTLTVNGAAKLGNSNYNNANQAQNGAAIFVNEGTGVIATNTTAIQYNIATTDSGGAVGVGDSSARLFFADNVTVKNNKQSSSGDTANVYLDQDSDTVITANGLGGSAEIGIYVPGSFDGDLFKHRGAASAIFASFTSNSNVGKFKNDRNTGLTAEAADNNKVRWVKKLTVEVRYLGTFENSAAGFPPAAAGTTLFTLSNYVMPSSENGASQIAADIYANYNTNLLKNVYPNAGFACAFKDGETSFGNYLTDVNWNGAQGIWQFIPRGWNPNTDPAPEPITGNKIIIYFSESTYLSLVNNTEDQLTLNLTEITVLGKNAVTDGYGYVTAKNGMTAEKLMPIGSGDLTIPAGHSIKFLFPGATNQSILLKGTFGDGTSVAYQVDGTPQDSLESPFILGQLTLPGNGGTRELLFGNTGLSICKVEEDGTEWPSLMAAMNHIVALKDETGETIYTIGMLVDYLQPPNDVLNIPDGYDITLTTDEDYSGTGKIGTVPAATLSRDAGNLGAMIRSDQNTIVSNAFHAGFKLENLIMDGRALVGTGDGGALKTKNATVTINNAYFKGFEATNGGALYVDFDTSDTSTHAYQQTTGAYLATMTVTNTDFLNCRSSSNEDKTGGGALWTTARVLTLDTCHVTGSSCYKDGAAQAGAIFHNINDKRRTAYSTNSHTLIRNCSFKDCYVQKASGGAVESDALDVVVEDCVFDTCYVKAGTKNGGGLNIYANNSEDPNANSHTTMRNTQFINCSSTNNGGAFRTTSEYVTMENVTFSKCKAKNGGGFAATGKYSKELTINGTSFDSCNANGTGGGGVYTTANIVTIGDYTAADGTVTHSSFTNCQSTNEGGGIYQNRDNSTFSMTNAVVNGNASTSKAGGGIYTKAQTVTLVGGVISNNTAKTSGGGIYQSKETSFTMTGTAISGNKATDNSGGGVYTIAKVVSLTDGSLTNNTATQTGGGLYTNAQTSLTIKGTEIKKNTATKDGGGVWYDGADDTKRAGMKLTLDGCSIDNNTSGASGGGVFTQVRTVEIKDSASISYNTANNGGGFFHRLYTDSVLTVKNSSINGNKAVGTGSDGYGGGLRTNAKTLTITNSSISNNNALNHGGGLWYDSNANDNNARKEMSLTVSGGNIDGNTSGGSGGGVFTQVKTVEIKDSASVSNNTAALNGGGLYHSLNAEGTKLTVTGGSIDGNRANGTGDNGLGGGVYTNVRSMTAKGASFSNNTASNSGGGVYDVNWAKDGNIYLYPGMDLTLQGCKLESNTSGGSGGGVYTIVGTLIIQDNPDDNEEATKHTVIRNCTAGGAGGGVCHDVYNDDATTTLTNCTVSGCSASGSNGGGGLFAQTGKMTVKEAVIRNNTASAGNGGGIHYTYNRAATWTENAHDSSKWDISTDNGLKLDHTTISGNTASAKGGGVYSKSYVWMLHASAITGNRLSSSAYGNAAGMYLENNITLIVGDPNLSSDPAANQNDTIHIKENYTISGAASNLRLWSDSSTGLNNAKSVYVFCHLDTESSVRVVNAYTVSTQFGYSNVPNPLGFTQGFTSDSAVFRADHNTLYGIIDRTQGNYQSIIWAGPAVCKITDGAGNLLYLRRNSDGIGADPAIFDRLDTGKETDTGITSAFSVLRGEYSLTNKDGSSTGFTGPELYYSNGDPYTGSEYCVKMLDSFTTESGVIIKYKEGRTITLTTASRNESEEGEYYYEYSKTVKTRGDTAKVIRGDGVGANNAMIYTKGDLIVSNIILDGGSLEPEFTAGRKTRLINATSDSNQHNIDVMLIDGAVLQNARTNHSDGNGAGVYLGKKARLTIGDEDTGGVIKNCSAPNGGAVYTESTSLGVEFIRGNIVQCEAEYDGGGVYYQGGESFTMSGGSIDRCTAGRDGGGVFVADGKTFDMTGTSRITGNHADGGGGGIAVGGENARLNFSVKPTVKGNTSSSSDAVNQACNVQLDWAKNGIINTVEKTWNGITYKGLANGASIGVYVSGNRDDQTPDNNTEPYRNHGVERTPFGTYQDGNNEKTFYSFVNDRNGLKGGLIANTGDHLIYWVKIFSLEVSLTGSDVAATGHQIPADETFLFKVQLTGEADVDSQPDAKDIDGDSYGGMTFHSDGVSSTTAMVELKLGENDTWENGVSCTAENLSAGLTYTITPMLTDAQKKQYVSIPAQYSGEIGENNKEGVDVEQSERYISRAPFQMVLAVCKLTNHNGGLLYYARDNAKYGEAHIPAVFSSLEDAAAALTTKQLYSGVNFTASSFTPGKGIDGVQLQMLVETCRQLSSMSIPANMAVTLKTASLEAVEHDVYTYRGSIGTTATILRGFGDDDANLNDSMFVANGELTVGNITLDGSKTTYKGDAIVTGNGGIVRVPGGGKLTLDHEAACLQESAVKGNGGAVYVAPGGEADIKAGKVKKNEATCGGAVYVEAGGKAAMSGGSVEDNKYVKDGTNGNGAGFYLAAGSTLELSGSPGFGSSLTGWGDISDSKGNVGTSLSSQTNGKKTYPVEHQDIYIAETTTGPALVLKDNLTGVAGSIWVWAENQERYGMANAFAKVDFNEDETPVTKQTYLIFRNAQTDVRTYVGDTNYLTGDSEREKDGFIHWTGGFDVIFKKIDGFGNAQSGAVFTLYTDPLCGTPYTRNSAAIKATSANGTTQTADGEQIDSGLVVFDKLPAGVYYMKETAKPAGYVNNNVYIILVGQAELAKRAAYGLTQASDITAQTGKYLADFGEKYKVKSEYAIFLYQDGKAVTSPDIAAWGIMNVSAGKSKVILRKVDRQYQPVPSDPGAQFQILRYDRSPVTGIDINGDTTDTFTSGASGVYFADSLPYGTYYVHETVVPAGYQKLSTDDNWFILTVNADGAGYQKTDETIIRNVSPAASAP